MQPTVRRAGNKINSELTQMTELRGKDDSHYSYNLCVLKVRQRYRRYIKESNQYSSDENYNMYIRLNIFLVQLMAEQRLQKKKTSKLEDISRNHTK